MLQHQLANDRARAAGAREGVVKEEEARGAAVTEEAETEAPHMRRWG